MIGLKCGWVGKKTGPQIGPLTCPHKFTHIHTCSHLPRYWEDLNPEERTKVVKDRLKKYTQKVCV